MRRPFARGVTAPPEVVARAGLGRGEKALAAAQARDGSWLLATRRALAVLRPHEPVMTVLWQQIESADWSRDDDRLRVSEVGEYGRVRPVHEFTLDEPGSILPVVRERVTASVVLQRRVVVRGSEGLSVVARRAPDGGSEVTWTYELDAGLDPKDPEVVRLAELGLRAAAEEIGLC